VMSLAGLPICALCNERSATVLLSALSRADHFSARRPSQHT
jgi:hypothetical protein